MITLILPALILTDRPGKLLRAIRLRQKIPQQYIAGLLSCSRSHLYQFEYGLIDVNYSLVIKYCQLLGYNEVIIKN